MALTHVIDAVNARLVEALTELGQDIPSFGVGDGDLALQAAPPRIVWQPTKGSISPADSQGGDGIRKPRPLFKRTLGFDVNIWAEDTEAADKLMQVFCAALYEVLYGSCNITAEDWAIGGDAVSILGARVVLSLTVDMPIVRLVDATATINTMPISPTVFVGTAPTG